MRPSTEFPIGLIIRCAEQISRIRNDPKQFSHNENLAIAVLRESGHAELVAALTAAKRRIFDCKENAMFSSKDTVVKHVAELLPGIDDALLKAGALESSASRG